MGVGGGTLGGSVTIGTSWWLLYYIKTDGWPWNHLEEAGSSGSEVVTGTKPINILC